MEFHHIAKSVHMLAAYTTAALMLLRLALDAAGRPGWRGTPLRWLPHLNDTVLLAAALGLMALTGWMPFVHHWLTGKVVLLVGYILAGKWALDQTRPPRVRGVAALVALVQLAAIFALATLKPF
jgi:uncharacterized membrane protein SirB2